MGLLDGWYGLLDTGIDEAVRLEDYQVRRWDRDGGTNLGSSRTNPFRAALPDEERPRNGRMKSWPISPGSVLMP